MKTETQDDLATGVGRSVPSATSCRRLIYRAYKFRIYPNAKQRILLAKHFGCCRFVYNHFLEERNKSFKDRGERMTYCDTAHELVQMRNGDGHEWLKEVYSHALQASLRNLDAAFQTFYKAKREGKAEPIIRDGKPTGRLKYEPNFKSKRDNAQSVTFPDNVHVMDGQLVLPKFKTPIKMKMHRPLGGRICHATVSRSVTGKYYVSILCEEECADMPSVSGEVGIDLGIKDMAVCSTGERVSNPKFLERGEKHLKYLQRQVSKKKKGGKNRRRARAKLSRHYENVANRRRDYIHKFTIRIVRENQTVCVEGLNVQGMQSNHHLAKSIGSVAFGEIARQLEYKCRWYGSGFVKVPRFYPSSKTCNHCGYVNHALTLGDREWICPNCGKEIDRDFNAALNILTEGKRILLCLVVERNRTVNKKAGRRRHESRQRTAEAQLL